MHAEEISAISPNAARQPSRRAGDILKLADGIFVGVLGMDGFAGRKSKPQTPDSHRLIPNTDDVHLDAALAGIVNRLVAEAIEIERAFELTVDPRQKIEVEGRGDAGRVIVGANQLSGVLFQIHADK